jgi:two-component system, cell cycle sensor histidine kinase and response regulator CckA
LKGRRVLVVDDDDLVRGATVRMLKRLGADVLEASTADAALEVARAHAGTIHLVVSDVALDGASGIELVRTLAGILPGIPSMLMSGSGESIPEGTRLLAKPFTFDELKLRVEQLIG